MNIDLPIEVTSIVDDDVEVTVPVSAFDAQKKDYDYVTSGMGLKVFYDKVRESGVELSEEDDKFMEAIYERLEAQVDTVMGRIAVTEVVGMTEQLLPILIAQEKMNIASPELSALANAFNDQMTVLSRGNPVEPKYYIVVPGFKITKFKKSKTKTKEQNRKAKLKARKSELVCGTSLLKAMIKTLQTVKTNLIDVDNNLMKLRDTCMIYEPLDFIAEMSNHPNEKVKDMFLNIESM